jgi:hypothetical protein
MNALTVEGALRTMPCPYAPAATLTVIGPCRAGGFPYAAGSSMEALAAQLCAPPKFDAVALALPAADGESLLARLAAVVHSVLYRLSCCAHGCADELYRDITLPTWEFRAGKFDYFPFAVHPLYPPAHPRHIAADPVLVFQSEVSFERHGISSSSDGRRDLSLLVESAFARAGRFYVSDITRNWPKAYRTVKPFHPSDGPVEWWREPLIEDIASV